MAGSAMAAGPNAVQNLPACTANTFGANDDESVADVPLGFTADFFGLSATTVNVNNNGNVTFDAPLFEYTPFDFTTSGNVIVAPFLADVDTRGVGSSPVTYGAGLMPDGTTHYFCVNWVNVGYFGEHADKLNSFQLLLTQTAAEAVNGNFTITFNYDALTWETGDASGGTNGFGGTPAATGFSAGDGVDGHDFVAPGSFTSGALLDSNGATGLIHNSLNSGGQLGRYVFPVVNGPVSGGRVHGTVFAADGVTTVEFAPVQLCPTAGGPCATRSTNGSGTYTAGGLAPGGYDVTAFPNSEFDGTSATVHNVVVVDGGDTAQSITLGPSPNAPPTGTGLTGFGTNPNGIPVINWSQSGTITTLACAGASLSYALSVEGIVVAGGPMQEVPGSQDGVGGATYQATYPAVFPHHGAGHVAITGTCPAGGSTVDTEFDVYIDPSGKVVDTNGDPIANATVTLRRSSSPFGPFVQVPDGSPEMSPGNRANPDTTRADGTFGWDVVAGYYRVDATKDGCVSAADRANPVASTDALQIPPPATDLVIRMYCGEAPRGGTTPPPPPPRATAASVEQAVAASLAGQLRGLLRQIAAKLSIAGTRAFTLPLSAAAPGTASLQVMTVPTGRRARASAHRKRRAAAVLVASGRVTVSRAGDTRMRVAVSARGRALLRAAARAHKRVKLRLTLAFTPTLDGRALAAAQTSGTLSVKPRAAKPRRHHRRH
ncbi:MAG: nidogen-like domain-containing protein [Conexibacter sp.]